MPTQNYFNKMLKMHQMFILCDSIYTGARKKKRNIRFKESRGSKRFHCVKNSSHIYPPLDFLVSLFHSYCTFPPLNGQDRLTYFF